MIEPDVLQHYQRGGRGYQTRMQEDLRRAMDCRVCGGAGYLATEQTPATCRYCKGTGREQAAPKTTRRILDVPCSNCGAAPGMPCTINQLAMSPKQYVEQVQGNYHRARIRRAR